MQLLKRQLHVGNLGQACRNPQLNASLNLRKTVPLVVAVGAALFRVVGAVQVAVNEWLMLVRHVFARAIAKVDASQTIILPPLTNVLGIQASKAAAF